MQEVQTEWPILCNIVLKIFVDQCPVRFMTKVSPLSSGNFSLELVVTGPFEINACVAYC